MKRMQQLLQQWETNGASDPSVKTLSIQLSGLNYARIQALLDLFPSRSEEQLVSELLTAALDEIEEAFPYVQGKQVIARDEFGDPVYADDGMTHRFEELTRKHVATLKSG